MSCTDYPISGVFKIKPFTSFSLLMTYKNDETGDIIPIHDYELKAQIKDTTKRVVGEMSIINRNDDNATFELVTTDDKGLAHGTYFIDVVPIINDKNLRSDTLKIEVYEGVTNA